MFKKLLLASTVFALSSGVALANGPYLGGSVALKVNTATNRYYRGMPANFFAGYGAVIGEGVYLGGEVIGTIGGISITDNGLKSTYGVGISFIPGLMISDHTLGYFRLGLVRTHFTPSGSGSSTVAGTQWGVGMQTSLMQNWDLRGEYTYTPYNHLSGISSSPKSDEFNLGLVYKFD